MSTLIEEFPWTKLWDHVTLSVARLMFSFPPPPSPMEKYWIILTNSGQTYGKVFYSVASQIRYKWTRNSWMQLHKIKNILRRNHIESKEFIIRLERCQNNWEKNTRIKIKVLINRQKEKEVGWWLTLARMLQFKLQIKQNYMKPLIF